MPTQMPMPGVVQQSFMDFMQVSQKLATFVTLSIRNLTPYIPILNLTKEFQYKTEFYGPINTVKVSWLTYVTLFLGKLRLIVLLSG